MRNGGPDPDRRGHDIVRSKWSRPQGAWLRRPTPVPGRTRRPSGFVSPNQWRCLPQWRPTGRLPQARHGARKRRRPGLAARLARWNRPTQRQWQLPAEQLGTRPEVAPVRRHAGGDKIAACPAFLSTWRYSQAFLTRRKTPSTIMLPAKPRRKACEEILLASAIPPPMPASAAPRNPSVTGQSNCT
jgi:hypothetical protein